jgi:ribosome maturation factor RimP
LGKVTTAVSQLVEPLCATLGLELVDITYGKEGNRSILRILIDKPGGITLDDCQLLTHKLNPLLDAADPIPGAYSLQVSSPGLDRPLKKEADFHRFAGRKIRLRLRTAFNSQRAFQGTLIGWQNDCIVMQHEGNEVQIPWKQVSKAQLVADV